MLGILPELAFYGVNFKAMVRIWASDMTYEGHTNVAPLVSLITNAFSVALVCLQRTNPDNTTIKPVPRMIL